MGNIDDYRSVFFELAYELEEVLSDRKSVV